MSQASSLILLLFKDLVLMSCHLGFDLVWAIDGKMQVNAAKYSKESLAAGPPRQKGERTIPKWSSLKELEGKRTCQSPPPVSPVSGACFLGEQHFLASFQSNHARIDNNISSFAKARGWLHSYTLRGLVVSLFSEYGELMSELEYRDYNESVDSLPESNIQRLANELADVAIYLFHLERTSKI